MKEKIRIGSRASDLAMWQANWVKSKTREWFPDCEVEIVKIKTRGDKILDVPLAKVGGKGLFVKELEEALIDGRVDLAVHSMKDVPAELPDPLTLYSITEREDVRDVLISRSGKKILELPAESNIGTSSLRRQSQLLNLRTDLNIVQLRGNINTRVDKAFTEAFDGIIVAAAGINRMGWSEKITEYIEPSVMLPAVGQGALGIEIRKDDDGTIGIVEKFNHPETSFAVRAERSFLMALEGGCQVPIAGYATVSGSKVTLTGLVASTDGRQVIRESDSDSCENAETLGKRLAGRLLSLGAEAILKEVYL